MALSGASSLISEDNLFPGEWPSVYAIVDPIAAPTRVEIGIVKSGVLRTGREELRFLGTTFPQQLESSAPINVTMAFEGQGFELKPGLLHFLVGDGRIDDATQYIYPGSACAFGSIDATLRGERVNCGGFMVAFQLHKARNSGAIEIGSNPSDMISTPMVIEALNATNDALFPGDSTNPLGWIWTSFDNSNA